MSEKSARDDKAFQSYLGNIRAKTGKTPEDFRALAQKKGLTKHGDIIAWLKGDFELGHGHANAIAAALLKSESHKASPEEKLGKLFTGKKAHWREAYDKLIAQVQKFGPDVEAAANETYVNVVRGAKKFAVVQPSSAERLDIGIKLKGVAAEGRLEPAGSWNSMVTHRVKVSEPKELDKDVLVWLRQAYDAAQ